MKYVWKAIAGTRKEPKGVIGWYQTREGARQSFDYTNGYVVRLRVNAADFRTLTRAN